MPANDSIFAETWRPVPGYSGSHEVSNFGNVRTVARRVRVGYGATRLVRPKIITQSRHCCGYLVVGLNSGNRSAVFLVHRIVAAAFLGTVPEGSEVNHKDGDKHNNAVENLEIVTRQENIDHAVRTGLISNKGELNAQAKLNAGQVQEIRRLYKAGEGGYKALGIRFAVCWGTIRDIVKCRIWKHLAP